MAMWGGRFREDAAPLFKQFNDSLPFDWRLVTHDITASIAWAGAIRDVGVLSEREHEELTDALRALHKDVAANPERVGLAGDEDVHGYVERRLIDLVGDLGRKLHTGRSRNDQVATDLRLWAREAVGERQKELHAVLGLLAELAEREHATAFPGFTHLQCAQPVTFGHWCLAYAEMFTRDAERLSDAMSRAALCPLGSGALAGTAYPIDRAALAAALGFDGPTRNSLDAVSDRDYVLELLNACALCAVHISRLAEDLIVYASEPFGLVTMSDRVTTGSSLMPQKKNPDALELLRGKAGRLVAAPLGLSVTLKGLPLAYNKDMQEDKEPLFASMDELSVCLRVLGLVLEGLNVRADRAESLAGAGYANATDLADALVDAGVPFRTAHDVVGRVVNRAIELGVRIEDMPIEELSAIAPQLDETVFDRLTIEAVLDRRDVVGGTAPERVRLAARDLKSRLHAEHESIDHDDHNGHNARQTPEHSSSTDNADAPAATGDRTA